MARVSVVIPTYNRAHLLVRAVRSVLSQTFADLEVLIVDDASAGDVSEALMRIRDRRVRYWRHDINRGVAAARNAAMSHASGEYIAFLDDDDEWLPDKLMIQLDRLRRASPGLGLLGSGHYAVGSDRIGQFVPRLRGRVFERLLTEGVFAHTSTIVARATCFESVGMFDESFPYGEDFDMWLRIARRYDVDFVPSLLVRQHAGTDGLSANYQAIVCGVEAHLGKYRDFFERNPAVFNARLQRLATSYCFAGDTKQGRHVLYRAMAQRPLALKNYAWAALALCGPQTFRSCYAARHALGFRIVRLADACRRVVALETPTLNL
jgi:glycosyltransferase involved in cell wall biosynthesis